MKTCQYLTRRFVIWVSVSKFSVCLTYIRFQLGFLSIVGRPAVKTDREDNCWISTFNLFEYWLNKMCCFMIGTIIEFLIIIQYYWLSETHKLMVFTQIKCMFLDFVISFTMRCNIWATLFGFRILISDLTTAVGAMLCMLMIKATKSIVV